MPIIEDLGYGKLARQSLVYFGLKTIFTLHFVRRFHGVPNTGKLNFAVWRASLPERHSPELYGVSAWAVSILISRQFESPMLYNAGRCVNLNRSSAFTNCGERIG